jgi:inorganic triphosphatase YgiF
MVSKQVGKSSGVEGSSPTDHTEIEWQFDTDELDPVESWLGEHASGLTGLVVAPESLVRITDSYYDTDDWRLYRAGYALRVRETDGEVEATMKSLAPADGTLRRRRESPSPSRTIDRPR